MTNDRRNHIRGDSPPAAGLPSISVIQLIGLVLIGGVVTFAIVAFILSRVGTDDAAAADAAPSLAPLRYAWVAVGVTVAVLAAILSATMRRAARARAAAGSDDAAIMSMYGSTTIMCLALWEAVGMFGAVILLLSGESYDLAHALVPLIGLAVYFPTTARWRDFLTSVRDGVDSAADRRD